MSRLLIAALAGVMTVFAFEFGGTIEGRLAPVMGPLQIVSVTPGEGADAAYVVVQAHALKRRNCDFESLSWYLGPQNGRRVEVVAYFRDPPQVRAPGELFWTGIVLNLTEEQLLYNSHAEVRHTCRHRLWQTRTRFYTSGLHHPAQPAAIRPDQ